MDKMKLMIAVILIGVIVICFIVAMAVTYWEKQQAERRLAEAKRRLFIKIKLDLDALTDRIGDQDTGDTVRTVAHWMRDRYMSRMSPKDQRTLMHSSRFVLAEEFLEEINWWH